MVIRGGSQSERRASRHLATAARVTHRSVGACSQLASTTVLKAGPTRVPASSHFPHVDARTSELWRQTFPRTSVDPLPGGPRRRRVAIFRRPSDSAPAEKIPAEAARLTSSDRSRSGISDARTCCRVTPLADVARRSSRRSLRHCAAVGRIAALTITAFFLAERSYFGVNVFDAKTVLLEVGSC